MSSYPDSSAGGLRTEPGAVRRRRLRLRISRRELARRVGVDVTLIEDVEQRGTAIYDHTVSAISDQLGCDPRDLAAMPFKTTRSTDPADIQLLGALLADFGAPVHEATIAAVFGWAPERRDAAETQLRERLQQLGQTVTRSPCGELAVAASAECVSDELRAALRHQALEFDDTSAHVLSLAAHGRVIERLWDELDEPMLAAASELMAAGIVDEHNGRLVLSTALFNALDARHLDGLGWW